MDSSDTQQAPMLCVAIYRFEDGRLVITLQDDPNKAVDVIAEALEQDGFGEVRARSPVMKIRAIRELEETQLFTLTITDLQIGQVFDTKGREFKTAPLSRHAVHAELDRQVEHRRANANVDPDVLARWPDWAAAIAARIADECDTADEDRPTLLSTLKECFLASPHAAHQLIGTSVIEADYLQQFAAD